MNSFTMRFGADGAIDLIDLVLADPKENEVQVYGGCLWHLLVGYRHRQVGQLHETNGAARPQKGGLCRQSGTWC